MLRCDIGGTNSYDCPIPASTGKCFANLECVATPPSTPPSPSSPPSANKYCKKLKRLKQAKKYVEKREGKQEKWEKKCSPSPP